MIIIKNSDFCGGGGGGGGIFSGGRGGRGGGGGNSRPQVDGLILNKPYKITKSLHEQGTHKSQLA